MRPAIMARAPRASRGTRIMPRHPPQPDMPAYLTLEDAIGRTPLVRLQRLPGAEIAARGNVILGKLEGNNPAGDRKSTRLNSSHSQQSRMPSSA